MSVFGRLDAEDEKGGEGHAEVVHEAALLGKQQFESSRAGTLGLHEGFSRLATRLHAAPRTVAYLDGREPNA